ncbi:MAG: hypothetical protein CBE43_07640 [Rhodopirellula sp. TMED283]|nr:MAG: hypothetical protein CBE43_07640 [Rhodopirellula sp. TMED283]
MSAKRRAPSVVTPVQNAGLEYRVPHKMIGCVEAWDTATKKRSWFRQIYVVRRNPSLESDVQDVFISRIRLDNKRNILEITNELGFPYAFDLRTLEARTVKGKPVVTIK